MRGFPLHFPPTLPSPRDCVATGENAVIPAKAGIQVFEIVVVFNRLDARLRGHDELRHSLPAAGEG
jgi:hypothetical protein